MSEIDEAQFDGVWAPQRYPTHDFDDATATWRIVSEAGSEVGIVWLSDASTGVRWTTQTPGINEIIEVFDNFCTAGQSMSSAYMAAATVDKVEFSNESLGDMADVNVAFQKLMDSVSPSTE